MKILLLHRWHSVPGGVKPTYLMDHGHEVLNPVLWSARKTWSRVMKVRVVKQIPQRVAGVRAPPDRKQHTATRDPTGQATKAAVRPPVIAMRTPTLNHVPSLSDRMDYFAPQALVTKAKNRVVLSERV